MEKQSQNQFILNFKQKLQQVKNAEYLIQNEILQIESFTTSKTAKSKFDIHGLNSKTNSVFDLSFYGSRNLINEIFIEYLTNGEYIIDKDDFAFQHKKDTSLIATQFAEYYLWLKELKAPKPKDKFTDLNIDQRVLALYYLFPSLKNYTKTQLAITLGQILNVGSENIRKNLSDISKIQTKENFYKLIDLFENKTFESITNKLEKEAEYFK